MQVSRDAAREEHHAFPPDKHSECFVPLQPTGILTINDRANCVLVMAADMIALRIRASVTRPAIVDTTIQGNLTRDCQTDAKNEIMPDSK